MADNPTPIRIATPGGRSHPGSRDGAGANDCLRTAGLICHSRELIIPRGGRPRFARLSETGLYAAMTATLDVVMVHGRVPFSGFLPQAKH
jgi:hypothetical protein